MRAHVAHVPGAAIAAACLAAAGCYDPSPSEGEPCSETGRCPTGLVCDPASLTCVDELPPAARFVQIDAGHSHSCGIDPDGALWCWGSNGVGELGLGDHDDRLVPAPVIPTGATWRSVSAGDDATCGIQTDGTLWCWGTSQAIGSDRIQPVQVGTATWTAVSLDMEGYCAIRADDQAVYCYWIGAPDLEPVRADTSALRATRLSASHGHVCVIDDQQGLSCWGGNDSGQLGDGTVGGSAPEPLAVAGAWTSVATSYGHTCGLRADATLWCWGACALGQTGEPDPPGTCPTPAQVGSDHYVAIDVGFEHTCALRGDGTLVCFGSNQLGQLGAFGGADTPTPTPVAIPGGWTAVTTGRRHTCGLRGDEAWCWGANRQGALGDGLGGNQLVPAPVAGGPWRSVAVGQATTCAIAEDGGLWCWGRNGKGELGDGTTIERRRPVQVGGERDWTAVSVGLDHACGVRAPGTLWCWGGNDLGQLGVGGLRDLAVPTRVGTRDDWREIVAVDRRTCGVRGAGELWCWGDRIFAETPSRIGTDTGWSSVTSELTSYFLYGVRGGAVFPFDYALQPQDEGNTDYTVLSAGVGHRCGLRAAGGLWCYGENPNGELGTGVADGVTQPAALQEITAQSWRAVDAGAGATCAINTADALYCWGTAGSGILGLGKLSGANEPTPTQVDAAAWRAIAIASHHTCGIHTDGSMACWGASDAGERGDGRGGTDRPTRVVPTSGGM